MFLSRGTEGSCSNETAVNPFKIYDKVPKVCKIPPDMPFTLTVLSPELPLALPE
jgi:hypothetical protein